MKWMLAILAVCAVSGGAQDDTGALKHVLTPARNGTTMVRISAREIARDLPYPGVIHLRGDVEVRTPFCVVTATAPKVVQYCDGFVVLHADEADFHEGTEQVDARGNVRMERTQSEH